MYEETRPEGRLARLEDWLSNVFWYHYKWYYIAGVFAATLLIVSVVSFALKVDYDWTVVYAHAGEADPAGAKRVQAAFERYGTETSGNRRVQVRVQELCGADAPGELGLYGPLVTSDSLLYALDGETLRAWQSLGWFTDAALPAGEAFCAAVNDVAVTPYRMEDFAGYNYTQEQIDEANVYRQEEHDKLAAAARGIAANLNAAA